MSEARECGVCWYVYSPDRGDEVWQVPRGTPFEALPAQWRCPRCDAARERFLPVADPQRDPRVAELVETSTRAWKTKMKGLPILNPRLEVEAVGFRPWSGGLFGALVTPWSINAVLFPPPGPAAPARGQVRELPAGAVDFLPLMLAGGSRVEVASLFSPVFQFESQAAARATASCAVELLLTPPAEAGPALTSRRDLLRPLLRQRS
jgi:[NiFe] hydrogenase assembly HybE family chaperone